MRVYLDTNVILDALATRKPWNEYAEKILEYASIGMIQTNISASSATDIYYILRKHTNDAQIAKKQLEKLFQIVSVLEVSQEDCINALASNIADYEDAVIEQIVKRHKLDCIVTRNLKDFKNASVKYIAPDQLLAQLENE